MFAISPISRFLYYRGSFSFVSIRLTMTGVEENRSLYRGLRDIEVRFIEVPLQLLRSSSV